MANFPSSVSTDANLYVAVNGLQTTLASNALITDTTLTLTSTSGFPTTGAVVLGNSEVVFYTGISGATLTGCTRGSDGTTASAWPSGSVAAAAIVAAHHNLLKNEIIAVETALGAGFAKGNLTAGSAKIAVTGGTGAVIGSGTSVDLGSVSLENLSDVSVSSPSSGQGLQWNGSAWINATPSGNYSVGQDNILINGGFEFWQRGGSFSAPANNAYTADRWKVSTNNAADAVISANSSTTDNSGTSAQVVISGSPSGSNWFLVNLIENYSDYAGKTITVTARVKCSVTNAVRVFLYDGVTQPLSSYHSGSGNWETLTVSLTVSSAPTLLRVGLGFGGNGDMQNGTYYFDNVMLVLGSQASVFVPTDHATELNQCQRYFNQIAGTASEFLTTSLHDSTTVSRGPIRFPVRMRVSPTLTVYGQTAFVVVSLGGNYTATAASPGSQTPDGFLLNVTVSGLTTGGCGLIATLNSTAYITADAEI